jgi:hypothetical protein
MAPRLGPAELAAFLLGTALAAQGRTITVDSQNRPGTDFTDFPPAYAAAADGDTIRVRDGSYSPARITKGLAILGDPGARFVTSSTSLLTIADLPSGRECVLKGIGFFADAGPSLSIERCAGRVILDRIAAPGSAPLVGASFYIEASAQVLVGRSQWYGGVYLHRSQVVFQDVSATGSAGALLPRGWQPGTVAIRADMSTLTIAGGTWTGGAGGLAPPVAAYLGLDSFLTLAGDASTRVAAGATLFGDVPAIILYNQTDMLRIDPSVTIVPAGNAPPIGGAGGTTTLRLPALRAAGAPPAGRLTADLFAPRGDAFVQALALPAAPLAIPPLQGSLWLDLRSFLELARGVVDASEHSILNATIPADPALRGKAFVLQALSGTGQRGFMLSNPAGIVID